MSLLSACSIRPKLPRPARLLLAVLLTLPLIAQPAPAAAQPAGESAEEATVFLQSYRLSSDLLPAGYVHAYDVAWTNDTEAFDDAINEPIDPRPASEILAQFEQAGRVVRLISLYTNPTATDAADLWYNVVLFRDPNGAAQALRAPGLAESVKSDDRVTRVDSPGASPGLVVYKVEKLDPSGAVARRNDLVLWQRGRVVFALAAVGTQDAVDALLPKAVTAAGQAMPRLAALPEPPATFGPSPDYLPPAAKRFELLHGLQERLPGPEAFPDFSGPEIDSHNNPELLNEAPAAAPPISDVASYKNALVNVERRIVGLGAEFKPSAQRAEPPGSGRPSFTVGYHLYADPAGAAEAINAEPAEIALRLYQEQVAVPAPPSLNELGSPLAAGEQARTLRGSMQVGDQAVEITTVRWRRGAVELYSSALVAAGQDPTELLRTVVAQLDGAYVANPLPGF